MRRAAAALLLYAAVRATGLLVLFSWAAFNGRDGRHLLVWWDAQWYKGIAENGYGFTRLHPDGRLLSDLAFFPLFPMLERSLSAVTGLRFVDSGLVISAVASLLAAWGIFAIGDRLHGSRVGVLLTVMWAALPVGIVASMAYSETLFTALAAWSLYAVLSDRWVGAGMLAALAGLTRPVGLAVVAAVVVPAALVLIRERRAPVAASVAASNRSRRNVLIGGLVAPLGWLGYVGWVGVSTGSPLGYFEVAGRWGNSFDGGVAFARWTWDFLTGPGFALGLLLCAAVVLLGLLFAQCVRDRQPIPLLLFGGLLLFVAMTTSGYFGSKPRYLMPAFPLLLPLAVRLARARTSVVVGVLALLASGSAVYGALWLQGPGPP